MKKALQISFISASGWLIILFCSCTKSPTESPIPQITLQSVQEVSYGQYYDSFNFVIGYQDGDGDIGLSQSDTTGEFNPSSIYYNNLYIDYYEKKGNKFASVKPTLSAVDSVEWAYRMPVISTEGKNKSIKGTISFGILDITPPPPGYYDSIMFKIYIYDRNLHKSNIVQSPVLVLQ